MKAPLEAAPPPSPAASLQRQEGYFKQVRCRVLKMAAVTEVSRWQALGLHCHKGE